jgi:hypothetical protein
MFQYHLHIIITYNFTVSDSLQTLVRGDLLIDDKPFELLTPGGKHTTATWKQIVFDAPYNRQMRIPRLCHWEDWKSVVMPLFGKLPTEDPYAYQYGEKIAPPTMRLSPRVIRNKQRVDATRAKTQWKQASRD